MKKEEKVVKKLLGTYKYVKVIAGLQMFEGVLVVRG